LEQEALYLPIGVDFGNCNLLEGLEEALPVAAREHNCLARKHRSFPAQIN